MVGARHATVHTLPARPFQKGAQAAAAQVGGDSETETIIERSAATDHFTIIPNALIRDARISRFARSVLIEILSNDPGWRNTADDFWRRARSVTDRSGEGRDAYRRAFRELESAGYITRTRHHDPQTKRWRTVLRFRDTAAEVAGTPTPDWPVLGPTPDVPVVGEPVVGQSGVNREEPQRSNYENFHGSTPVEPSKGLPAGSRGEPRERDLKRRVQAVRAAMLMAYGSDDEIDDDDALALYLNIVGDRDAEVRKPASYIAKIFGDTPHVDTLLANCHDPDLCHGCGYSLAGYGGPRPSGLCVWCDPEVNGTDDDE